MTVSGLPRRRICVLAMLLVAALVLAAITWLGDGVLANLGQGLGAIPAFVHDDPLPPEPPLADPCNAQSDSCVIVRASQAQHQLPAAPATNASSAKLPRILYYNTHGGTTQNMRGITHALGLALDLFNPSQVSPYGMSAARATLLIESSHVSFICNQYDIVIISDTVPHGRALLQSLVHPNKNLRCSAKLVVEMTNRFDWDVKDRIAYYSLIRTLILDPNYWNRVYWVVNNNVEQAYVELYTGAKMRDVRLLRPVGMSKDYGYPDDLPPASMENFAARTHDTTQIFESLRDDYAIPLTIFPFGHKYGGPKNLLNFKGWIDVPYQYSVMKFYENIAYGVPQFVPTPRLFEFMLQNGMHYTHCIFIQVMKQFPIGQNRAVKVIPGFPEWSGYMDYYDPLFAPYVYYFDSIIELQQLRLDSRQQLDWKDIHKNGIEFYNRYRIQIFEGWAQLFRDMGFPAVGVQS
ncbi:hypothetical protein HK100_003893 [Physocladia obscura]|uniref:Uncharacterized protein n=1 Tax=Physocladia obscura TaxID=109957 RepID=A0AAD5SUG4_9FUNG|nr:hypothetical protein HK100_003893 [Physocladia obscura]